MNLFRISDCIIVPTFCHLVDYLCLLLENSLYKQLGTNPLFALEFCVVQQDKYYPHQDYEQGFFPKRQSLYLIDRSIRDKKVSTYLRWLKLGTLQKKCDKKTSLIYTPSHLTMLRKKNENSEFVQGVNFEIIDALENNIE